MSEGRDTLRDLEAELKELEQRSRDLTERVTRELERVRKERLQQDTMNGAPIASVEETAESADSQEEQVTIVIWDALAALPQPFGVQEACEATGMARRSMFKFLRQAISEGAVERVGFGKYRVKEESSPQGPPLS